ncbi:MAG: hypothetical protein COA50_01055 [Flavobacteriaceae bacterium]|nr:MAG: hypothetical protein COA50_01055 [Flavobacteriaceae bacterium]
MLYVGTHDTTISGSRNDFLALNLWYVFQKKGAKVFKEEGKQCIKNATYLTQKLKENEASQCWPFSKSNHCSF